VLDGAPSLAHPGERLLEFEHLEDHVSVELSILAETAQGGELCIAEGEMLPEPVNGREIGPERDRQHRIRGVALRPVGRRALPLWKPVFVPHLALEYQVQEPLKGQYRSGRAAIASGSALGDRAVGP